MKAMKFIEGCEHHGNVLYRGEILLPGQYLTSLNRKFTAVMQPDGDFVVYNAEKVLWRSNTCAAGNYLEFAADDGVVKMRGGAQWRTANYGADILVMQDDGNLVAYTENGTPIWSSDTWMYGKENTQPFCLNEPDYSGTHIIANVNGLVLDVALASQEDWADIIMRKRQGSENQQFAFQRLNDNSYKITAVHSGKVLDVRQANKADGAKIIQYSYHNGDNQRWYVVGCDYGEYVKFISVNSGKCLDIPGNSSEDGTPLQQYRDNGTIAQRFRLVNV